MYVSVKAVSPGRQPSLPDARPHQGATKTPAFPSYKNYSRVLSAY